MNPHNASTLSILGTLIKENRIKKWNNDTISVYEILTGMTVVAYANYYQKVRFIYNLFDFDGNQAIDINEISILVIAFCQGWSRFTNLKMPSNKRLETYGEYVAFLFSPFRSIMRLRLCLTPRSRLPSTRAFANSFSLGHWIEVNEEIMAVLSRFEPPLEVEEKDSTFLKLDRSASDIVTCS